MLLLRKQFAPLLCAAFHLTTAPLLLPSSLQRRALSISSSTSAAPHTTTPFPIEEYLVATCGLTRAQALKASKKIPRFNAWNKPDAVLALLAGVGLSRPDIAAVVAEDPLLLRARAGNIGARLASLRDRVGLSVPEIARFLVAGGAVAIRSGDVVPKLEFWIRFFGSFNDLLIKIGRTDHLLRADLEKVIKPNIALLEQCGLRACDIVRRSSGGLRLITADPGRVKRFVLRADKLGVPRSSSAFKYAVRVAACVHEDNAAMRMKFLKSTLDCSMEKVRAAVCKTPQIIGFSQEMLRRKIDFMITEVGLDAGHIVERPVLLTYSLEKRMVPRYHVAKILQEKGLMKKSVHFYPLIACSENNFVTRCIDCHEDTIPGLADAYAAACAGDSKKLSNLSALL